MRLAAVALIPVLAIAVGCGGDDDETTTDTTTAPAATGVTGAAPEQVEPPAEVQDDDGRAAGPDASASGSGPRVALMAFFTSGDPDLVCGELATERLLSSAYGDEKGCRQAQVPAAIPDSIEIHSLETAGDEARAVVTPTGGPNDGIETDVMLVSEGGTWRVDSLKADVPAGP